MIIYPVIIYPDLVRVLIQLAANCQKNVIAINAYTINIAAQEIST